MFRFLKGCFGRILTLLAILVALFVGWKWGSHFFPAVQEWLGMAEQNAADAWEATPELADSIALRIQAFGQGEAGDRMALGAREITSLLRFNGPEFLPRGIADPSVRFDRDLVEISGRVTLEAFPSLPDLGPIIGFLPDTLDVDLEASVLALGDGEGALLVRGIEASKIPLPRRLIPQILSAFGADHRPGLPPEAFAFRLPRQLSSAYIESDSVILTLHH